MILTEDRIDYIANAMLNEVNWNQDWVDFRDTAQVIRFTKQVISDYCSQYEGALGLARQKLDKQKTVVPGSAQWDILFEKYIQEELRKKGF